MILAVTALIVSIFSLVYQLYTMNEDNKRFDEFIENERNRRRNKLNQEQ